MISREEHEQKKKALCAALQSAQGVRLGKSTSNLFRHRVETGGARIDVRNFNNVITIDTKKLFADVEGMTTYEDFVNETLKFGLMPTVVPEFKTITVGGATTGVGLEASSFKYGFVHETVTEMDVVLAGGTVLTCSKTRNTDLFYGFPSSYGTLGYALRLRVKLVPVKPYVKVQHVRFDDFKAYFAEMQRLGLDGPDFIDGTIFSNKEMYITTGTFVENALYLNDYSYMKIFYKSIRKRTEDYMTTLNFLWRWDTDWYWHSKKFGAENPLVRALLGRKRLRSSFYWNIRSRLSKTSFWKMLRPIKSYETVVQDVDIPIETAAAFMDFLCEEIRIKPVWACPVNAFDKRVKFPLYPLSPSTTYVNLGFWDMVPSKHEKGHYNRMVEQEVTRIRGRKILYSDAFYPEEEFYQLYGGTTYAKLKKKYDPAGAFKTTYEKIVGRK
ncbi:MAG: FAD-binding oxidoreductase [Nanoarchaeota archaeon]